MMLKRLLVLLFMVWPVFVISAQEASAERYEAEGGLLSFEHPVGWVVEGGVDSDGFFYLSTSPESFEDFSVNSMQPGQQGVVFFGFPEGSLENIPPDLPPDQLANTVMESLMTDAEEPMTLSEASLTTLANGIEAGRIDLQGGAGRGAVYVYQQNGYVVLAALIAHEDEIADFEPQALEIIESFVINPDALNEPNELPELSDLLQADLPLRHVIVDLDMAQEDMTALLFLLNHPQIKVEAVTVVGTGEAHCEAGVANALGLLVLSGNLNIPVACGRETPLTGDHAFPDAWRENADSVYGVALPEVGSPNDTSAIEMISSVVSASPEPIVLVALGPLTNLADVLQASPQITDNIDAIYIMGGAVDVPGNVGPSGVGIDNDVAEWNIYIDPAAANIVLQSGVPVTLVALDATADVPMTTRFQERLGDVHATDAADFVYEVMTANVDAINAGGMQFWDSLTAAILTDESLASFETFTLLVVEEEGPESGYTRPDDEGVPVRVAVGADRQGFETLLLAVLNFY